MLAFLRKRAQSLVIQAIVVVIALVFIFWGVGTNMMNKQEAAIIVNGEEISFQSYQQAYDRTYARIAEQFGGTVPKALADSIDIRGQVISQLIQEALLRQGGQTMGLRVSSREIQEEIESMVCLSRRHDDHPNTGLYRDGFGNLIDVLAVANPLAKPAPRQTRPQTGRNKVAGWGIVRMDKEKGTATMEAWFADADVANPAADAQMPGWPITVDMAAMGGPGNPTLPPVRIAPSLIASLKVLPVVEVTDSDGHVVSTVRMQSDRWAPIVFNADGAYQVVVKSPEDGDRVLGTFDDVKPGEKSELLVQ